jgi:hypothetical protein
VTREKIVLPAGTFDAYRVEGEGEFGGTIFQTLKQTSWYAPDQVRNEIAGEIIVRSPHAGNRVERHDQTQLVEYRQG